MTNHKLLKSTDITSNYGLSRSHMYALIQKGEFPKPIKLSERSSAWLESEVREWVESRIASRDGGASL
jgi:prophage regulatory protein